MCPLGWLRLGLGLALRLETPLHALRHLSNVWFSLNWLQRIPKPWLEIGLGIQLQL